MKPTLAERFWPKVNKAGPISIHRPDLGSCWLWTASLTKPGGHGKFWIGGSFTTAHRASYEILVGPIPDGRQLDHLCRVRHCVNPAHLEPVSSGENTLRGVSFAAVNAAKDCCPSGHLYDEANTRIYRGRRYCRTCNQNGGQARLLTAARDLLEAHRG